MSDECRVLVTAGGTATALSVLKGLRMQAIAPASVLLVDPEPCAAARYLADAYRPVPPAADPGFVDALVAEAEAWRADLVIPVFDDEFLPLARAADRFAARGIRLVVSPLDAIATCRDKLATHRHFVAHGIPTPETYSPGEAEAVPASDYPLIVKPRDGRGSEQVVRVTEPSRLGDALREVRSPLVQRDARVSGALELTVDTFSDQHGRFVAACPRVREVVKAGQSYRGVTLDDPEVVRVAERCAETLGIVGPACIQCFRTPDAVSVFEVNPRFGAATVLSMVAGLNAAELLVAEHRGLALAPPRPRAGVRMLRYWSEVFVLEGAPVTGPVLVPGEDATER